jgi:hypothetical protein
MSMEEVDLITGILANVAAFATATVAILFFAQFHLSRRSKRLRLENYLKAEAAETDRIRTGSSARTILQLVKELGMSDTEVVDASFRSKCVFRRMSRTQPPELLLEFMPPEAIAEERQFEEIKRASRPSWWNVRI